MEEGAAEAAGEAGEEDGENIGVASETDIPGLNPASLLTLQGRRTQEDADDAPPRKRLEILFRSLGFAV